MCLLHVAADVLNTSRSTNQVNNRNKQTRLCSMESPEQCRAFFHIGLQPRNDIQKQSSHSDDIICIATVINDAVPVALCIIAMTPCGIMATHLMLSCGRLDMNVVMKTRRNHDDIVCCHNGVLVLALCTSRL